MPPDYLPWPVPVATIIYIAVYLLLENKQARGRHYFSKLMKYLGVDLMTAPKDQPTTGCLRCPQRIRLWHRPGTPDATQKLCRDCRYVLGREQAERYVA